MKLAFMHIPKTGGISVERTIKIAGGPDLGVCPTYFPHEYAGKVYKDIPGYDVYIGHFRVDFVETLPSEYVKATVVRKPADLLLSLYNHIHSRPAHRLHAAFNTPGVKFSDLVAKHSSMHNTLTKYLLGARRYDEICLDKKKPRPERIAAAVEAARENLKMFDVVGTTNRLENFVARLGGALGVEFQKPGRENINKKTVITADALTDEDKAVIHRTTRFDQAVFRMARNEFVQAGKPERV